MTVVFKQKSRIKQTTTSTGTGDLSLIAPKTGQRTFVTIGDGNKCCYVVDDGNGNWEEGVGTVHAGTPDTLSRTTVTDNSLGTTALINFTAGTKTVSLAPIPESLVSFDPTTLADGDLAQYSSANGWQMTTLAALLKTMLTTDGDLAFNNSGTVVRGSVASVLAKLLTTDGDVAFNNSGTVVRGSVATALAKLLTTSGDVAVNISGTVSRQTQAQLLALQDKVRAHFSAFLTSTASNATGDGTTLEPTAYTVTTNVGGCYASGLFTAPAAGTLIAVGAAFFGNIGAAHTQAFLYLKRSDGTFFYGADTNAANQKDSSSNWCAPIAQKIHMTAGQTVIFGMRVSNSTKTVSVFGTEGQTQIGGFFIAD